MAAFHTWLSEPSKYCTNCGSIQTLNTHLKGTACMCGNKTFEEMDQGRSASIREAFMQDEVDKAMQRGKYRVGGPEDLFGDAEWRQDE